MLFTFNHEYQAVEFASDCAYNGIVVIRDGCAVQVAETKIALAAQLLLAACNS